MKVAVWMDGAPIRLLATFWATSAFTQGAATAATPYGLTQKITLTNYTYRFMETGYIAGARMSATRLRLDNRVL